jgi:hypothetical protein
MKEWILMGANKAGFTLKEGGAIKNSNPWPAESQKA